MKKVMERIPIILMLRDPQLVLSKTFVIALRFLAEQYRRGPSRGQNLGQIIVPIMVGYLMIPFFNKKRRHSILWSLIHLSINRLKLFLALEKSVLQCV
ncbi:MAG: hypothetical protein ACI9NY_001246 [Kiritimatiellia bacterium]